VVRCLYLLVNPAEAGTYRPANKSPINRPPRLKQVAGRSRTGAWARDRILKSRGGERGSRTIFRSIQIEVSSNHERPPRVLAEDIR
jgi:hypothetical protein